MIARDALLSLAKALEGVPVLGTLDGSPAARLGVRYGDIVLSVNGIRTRTVSDYLDAKERRTEGMNIVVFRDGVEELIELPYDGEHRPPLAVLHELVGKRMLPSSD